MILLVYREPKGHRHLITSKREISHLGSFVRLLTWPIEPAMAVIFWNYALLPIVAGYEVLSKITHHRPPRVSDKIDNTVTKDFGVEGGASFVYSHVDAPS